MQNNLYRGYSNKVRDLFLFIRIVVKVYLALDQLLDVFDSSYAALSGRLVDVLLGAPSHLLVDYFLGLAHRFGRTQLAAHSKLWEIRARRP